MGKVLSAFTNGWPGAASRAVDNVIISIANGTDGEIPFGVPVFFVPGENACMPFNTAYASDYDFANFIGFTVRSGVKTPEEYGSNKAVFNPGDPVEILTRGAIVVQFGQGANPGAAVYIRKSDGKLVTNAGASGSTLALTNVHVKTASDSNNCAEVVVLERNML